MVAERAVAVHRETTRHDRHAQLVGHLAQRRVGARRAPVADLLGQQHQVGALHAARAHVLDQLPRAAHVVGVQHVVLVQQVQPHVRRVALHQSDPLRARLRLGADRRPQRGT